MLAPTHEHPPGLVSRVLLAPIRGYQRWVSPVLPASCRFYPTCSQYAVDAIRTHGALRGLGLATARLLKCGPWHPGGVDFVKPPKARRTTDFSRPADHPEHHES